LLLTPDLTVATRPQPWISLDAGFTFFLCGLNKALKLSMIFPERFDYRADYNQLETRKCFK
jgi:hypothetical protein